MTTLKDVLQGARARLADIEHWTQEEFAIENTGAACHVFSADCYATCALGAVAKATGTDPASGDALRTAETPFAQAWRLLDRVAPQVDEDCESIIHLNDCDEPHLAHAKVLQAFDLAIQRA